MNWLDRLMDRLTSRGTKIAAAGHPPADIEPATGSPELSEELEADYGPDSPAAAPPLGAPETDEPPPGDDAAEAGGTVEQREIRSGDMEGLAADESAAEHFGGRSSGDVDPPRP